MRKNTDPRWLAFDVWGCPRHIPMCKMPAVVEKCWYCGVERPLEQDQPAVPARAFGAPPNTVKAIPNIEKCAWPDCPNRSVGKSKYCSRNCSNKNARSRHTRKVATTPSPIAIEILESAPANDAIL